MSDFVSVQIKRSAYERLHRLAILSGDETSAIERLIDHWEKATAGTGPAPRIKPSADRPLWRSPSGDALPVGQVLEAPYLGQTLTAVVQRGGIQFNGTLWRSLTAAAQAAKLSVGSTAKSVSTNGREFWKVRDPDTGRLIPVSALRPTASVDVDRLLAELDAL